MKIFVSYASSNREIVKSLVEDLQDLDNEVWFDQELSGGQEWWDSILKQILECDLFVFTLTQDSLASEPCKRERQYAYDLHKRILPVHMGNDVDFNQLPPELAKIHAVNYTSQDKTAFKTLQKAMNSLGEALPLPNPLPKAPPIPMSPLNKISKMLELEQLSVDEQWEILRELKSLKRGKTQKSASELLQKFSLHPALLKRVADELESEMSKNSITRVTTDKEIGRDAEKQQQIKEEIRTLLKEMLDSITPTTLQIGVVHLTLSHSRFSIHNKYFDAKIEDLSVLKNSTLTTLKGWDIVKKWDVFLNDSAQKKSRLISKIADELITANIVVGYDLKLTDIRWIKS